MGSLTPTLIIILVIAALTPLLSKQIRLPVIVIEIVIGVILGRSFLNIIPTNHPLLEFFSSFGLVYLMFLAGLEINFEEIKKSFSKIAIIALFSILIPFLSGVIISSYVGMHPILLGVIFSTTCLGLILPILRELKCDKELSQVVFGSVVLVETVSIFLLAFSLTFIRGHFSFSFFYSFLMIIILFIIPWGINRSNVKNRMERWITEESNFSIMTRFSFALIVILTAVSEELGFHSVIGAFIAGLIISEMTPKAWLLEKKLESFGYGFFIPVFFILMGAKINLVSLFSDFVNIKLLIIIIIVGILSKFISVSSVSKIVGFSLRKSFLLGLLHTARLSLMIAALEIGAELGLIDENLFSSFMILAVVSAILGPSLGKYILAKKLK